MSNEQEKINRELARYPWTNKTFFNRPHWTRRGFFEMVGAGVTGAYLSRRYAKAAETTRYAGVTANPKGTAKNVIFVLLNGAPSHTDTFDLKVVPGVTPTTFNPDTINGIAFPTGLLPNLTKNLQAGDFTIVR